MSRTEHRRCAPLWIALLSSVLTAAAAAVTAPTARRRLQQSSNYQHVGSFLVGAGPSYAVTPPPYSCQEACAVVFGAAFSAYQVRRSP
jgi:hypothetical protein